MENLSKACSTHKSLDFLFLVGKQSHSGQLLWRQHPSKQEAAGETHKPSNLQGKVPWSDQRPKAEGMTKLGEKLHCSANLVGRKPALRCNSWQQGVILKAFGPHPFSIRNQEWPISTQNPQVLATLQPHPACHGNYL